MKIIEEGVEVWATKDVVKKGRRGKRLVADFGDMGQVVKIDPVRDQSGEIVKGEAKISVEFGDEVAQVTLDQVTTEQVIHRGYPPGKLAPRYEFEAWLALFPDLLEDDVEEVIDDFLRETTISDDRETRQELREVFDEYRQRELESETGE